MRHLAHLPNNIGYRFTGIDHDGNRHPCVVKLDSIGMCCVRRIADEEPFFFQLSGWEPIAQSQEGKP